MHRTREHAKQIAAIMARSSQEYEEPNFSLSSSSFAADFGSAFGGGAAAANGGKSATKPTTTTTADADSFFADWNTGTTAPGYSTATSTTLTERTTTTTATNPSSTTTAANNNSDVDFFYFGGDFFASPHHQPKQQRPMQAAATQLEEWPSQQQQSAAAAATPSVVRVSAAASASPVVVVVKRAVSNNHHDFTRQQQQVAQFANFDNGGGDEFAPHINNNNSPIPSHHHSKNNNNQQQQHSTDPGLTRTPERTSNTASSSTSSSQYHQQQPQQQSSAGAAARRRVRTQMRSRSTTPPPTEEEADARWDSRNNPTTNNRSNTNIPTTTTTNQNALTGGYLDKDSNINISSSKVGFTFDAFGLDGLEMQREVNEAVNALAGSHPGISLFYEDSSDNEFGRWGNNNTNHSNNNSTANESLNDSATAGSVTSSTIDTFTNHNDNDAAAGFVDGFRVTKSPGALLATTALRRASPTRSERSSLTSESLEHHNAAAANFNPMAPTISAGRSTSVNMFKQQAGFHSSSANPRRVVRPQNESLEASPPTPMKTYSPKGGLFPMGMKSPTTFQSPPQQQQRGTSVGTRIDSTLPDIPVLLYEQTKPTSPRRLHAEAVEFYGEDSSTDDDENKQQRISIMNNVAPTRSQYPAEVPHRVEPATNVGTDGGRASDSGVGSEHEAPSDIGVSSEIGTALSDIGTLPFFVGKDKKPRSSSVKTESTSSTTTATEEKKDDDNPRKSVDNLRSKWETRETAITSEILQKRLERQRVPSSLSKEHIIRLQDQLGDDLLSPEKLMTPSELASLGSADIPNVDRPDFSIQKIRSSECLDQRTSFVSAKERLKSPGSRPALQSQRNVSKSEGGAAVRHSSVGSILHNLEKTATGSPIDSRSDGGGSPATFGSKLRKTGFLPGISPVNASKRHAAVIQPKSSPQLTSPRNSTHSPGRVGCGSIENRTFESQAMRFVRQQNESPSNGRRLNSPRNTASPKETCGKSMSASFRDEKQPNSAETHSESRKHTSYCGSLASETSSPKQLTYRERRELELKRIKESELLRNSENTAESVQRDVATLIKQRIAANKKNPTVVPSISYDSSEDRREDLVEQRYKLKPTSSKGSVEECLPESEVPSPARRTFYSNERDAGSESHEVNYASQNNGPDQRIELPQLQSIPDLDCNSPSRRNVNESVSRPPHIVGGDVESLNSLQRHRSSPIDPRSPTRNGQQHILNSSCLTAGQSPRDSHESTRLIAPFISIGGQLHEKQQTTPSVDDTVENRFGDLNQSCISTHRRKSDLVIKTQTVETDLPKVKATSNAAVSHMLMLQQIQQHQPQEQSSGLHRPSPKSDKEALTLKVKSPIGAAFSDSGTEEQISRTPKATMMMLNAFLAGRESVSAIESSTAPAISRVKSEDEASNYGETRSLSPSGNHLPALKEDPKYSRYFKMLSIGMPIEVVKHAMTRDGLDATVMDNDHSKPVGIPLKDDPEYSKYFRMLSIGLPMEAVKHAMERDGLDSAVMDQNHDLPASTGKESGNQEPKEIDSHRRARLHWKTLRKVTSNSLWAKIDQDTDLNIEIDEEEFQELFQAERTEAAASSAVATSTQKRGSTVCVIDSKRANNGGIILARLKMSHDDMAEAVDRIDEQDLTAEQIENVVEYLPTKEERKALENYMLEGGQDAAEKFDGLCECEKFMVSMMTVKHAKRKVSALLFKLQFESCIRDIQKEACAIEQACEELSSSVRLRQLLGIVLTFGNRLNTAGNGKRKAGAFTLDSLLKLNQAKAFDKKTTFLHYIILIVQRNNELLLNFKDDLPTVFASDKIFWDQCVADLEEVENQLENVRKIALYQAHQAQSYRLRRKSKRDDPDESLSDNDETLSLEEEVEALRSTPIGLFTLSAIKYVSALRDKIESTKVMFAHVLEYFGEEEKQLQPHELFSIIVSFSRDFDKAKEQVSIKEKLKLREERKRSLNNSSSRTPLSGRPPTSSPYSIERHTTSTGTLKVSNLQPNISSVLYDMHRGLDTVENDTRGSPQRQKPVRVDAVHRESTARPIFRPPEPPRPETRGADFIQSRQNHLPTPPYPSHTQVGRKYVDVDMRASPTPSSSSVKANMRAKARLRRHRGRMSPSSVDSSLPSTETGHDEDPTLSNCVTGKPKAPFEVNRGMEPPLSIPTTPTHRNLLGTTSDDSGAQPLSPRSSIRLKRRMEHRNSVRAGTQQTF